MDLIDDNCMSRRVGAHNCWCLRGWTAHSVHINCERIQLDECWAKAWFATSGHFDEPIVKKYFLCGPFPQSPGELSWTHFCVSTPYPFSIGLRGSLAYSRCSINVYQMKSLFLRAWWGSTAERIQWALFPMNSLVWSLCLNGSWAIEKTDSAPTLGVSGQCMGRREAWGHP